MAVRIAVDKKQALEGVRWYNNDSESAFPVVLVASGREDVPPLYADGVVAAQDVAGTESGWSDVTFVEPIGSDSGTLYVIFQLPAFEEAVEDGAGPAFGYLPTETKSCVYLSVDGDDWSRLVTSYQLMVEPVYTDRGESTLALKSTRDPDPDLSTPEVVIERTELLQPYPNPFNPQVKVAFTLKEAGHVEIAVYDLRGRRVRQLLSESMPVGAHEVVWRGDNDAGARLASGVYFAQMKADRRMMIRRLTLVK